MSNQDSSCKLLSVGKPLSVFFSLAHLALQNVNKDYVIFLYFRNFIAKNDQKPKTKNGIIETNVVTFDKNKHLRTVCILKPQAVPSSFRRFAAAENEQ